MKTLAALAMLAALTACGSQAQSTPEPEPTTQTEPTTFSASGFIDVFGYSRIMAATGTRACIPESGYEDILGAQVTVSGPNGDVVAVGRLELGKKHGYDCRYPFTVSGVPAGLALYSVEVSHRGALTYSQAEMEQGLEFTLN